MGAMSIGGGGGMIKATWDDRGLVKALNRSERGVRPAATKGMHQAGRLLAAQMRQNLKSHGKVDTRALADSIDYRLDDRRGRQSLTVGPGAKSGKMPPHALAVEYGRKPGQKAPPPGSLVESGWLGRHGFPDSAEFVVARKIGIEGTKPFPYIEPAAEQMGSLLGVVETDIMAAVLGEWSL